VSVFDRTAWARRPRCCGWSTGDLFIRASSTAPIRSTISPNCSGTPWNWRSIRRSGCPGTTATHWRGSPLPKPH